jgi:hypothetical protein
VPAGWASRSGGRESRGRHLAGCWNRHGGRLTPAMPCPITRLARTCEDLCVAVLVVGIVQQEDLEIGRLQAGQTGQGRPGVRGAGAPGQLCSATCGHLRTWSAGAAGAPASATSDFSQKVMAVTLSKGARPASADSLLVKLRPPASASCRQVAAVPSGAAPARSSEGDSCSSARLAVMGCRAEPAPGCSMTRVAVPGCCWRRTWHSVAAGAGVVGKPARWATTGASAQRLCCPSISTS